MRASGTATSVAAVLGIALLLATLAACGKKGPPLAPLHLVPAAVGELTARRSGDDVELRFSLPSANANGPGDIDLARVEVYAITIAQGAVTPPNRDLLVNARVVGTIAVRPPPVEGETPAPGAPPDKRPAPGERVTFVDQLTAEKLKPVVSTQKPAAGGPKPAGQTPGPRGRNRRSRVRSRRLKVRRKARSRRAPAWWPARNRSSKGRSQKAEQSSRKGQLQPQPPCRRHRLARRIPRASTRFVDSRDSGRPGLPSTRVVVPLLGAVPPPTAVAAQMPTEKAVVVDWTPPVAEPGGTPLAFNVYRREDTATPLNPSPLSDVKFETGSVEYRQGAVLRRADGADVSKRHARECAFGARLPDAARQVPARGAERAAGRGRGRRGQPGLGSECRGGSRRLPGLACRGAR